jgi:hypothetical protein
MASKSKLEHLAGQVDTKIEAIKMRAGFVQPGTPASDRLADLLRELSTALDDFGTRSVDIYNVAYQAGQGTE